MRNKRLVYILATVTFLLLIPLISMRFTSEVNWSIIDFALMGGLLFGVGLLCEFVLRKVRSSQNRIILCGAILFTFFLVWAELAVGIFGSPFAGS